MDQFHSGFVYSVTWQSHVWLYVTEFRTDVGREEACVGQLNDCLARGRSKGLVGEDEPEHEQSGEQDCEPGGLNDGRCR